MLRKLSRYLGHNILGLLALFVALGGTAYAVNTVNSSDIVDGQVKSVDVGQNEIGSADVKDNSLNTFDVHSFLGVDVVDGSLTGADIQNGSLIGYEELANNSVVGNHIIDGVLNDRDIADEVDVDFGVNIGTVNATSCVYKAVSGLTAYKDHLVLTPSAADSDGGLVYSARYDTATSDVQIHVCNFAGAPINDGITHFNLLVINATPDN